MNHTMLIIVIFTISIILFFCINLLFIKRMQNKKRFFLISICVFIGIIIFYLVAYFPRTINKKYLKDDSIKIYCCYYDLDQEKGIIIEINNNKYSDITNKIKEAYYIPYYDLIYYESISDNFNYFVFQYSNYYLIIGEKGWKYVKGEYINYYVPTVTYTLNHSKGATTKNMYNFDFEELKQLFT